MRQIEAISTERYRATAAQRRQYGGATITVFFCRYVDWQDDIKKSGYIPSVKITGYGPMPGNRVTDAKRRFKVWAFENEAKWLQDHKDKPPLVL